MKGIAASPGEASGAAWVLTRLDESSLTALPGFVLVVRNSLPEWAVVLDRAVAVVSETGGATSHLASLARELGIPCVVGVKGATGEIANGAYVLVSGTTGTVTVLDGPRTSNSSCS